MATPSGAVYRWDARAHASPPVDGSALLEPTDQSGTGWTPDAAVANRAIWRATALNGQPCMDFEGGAARYQWLSSQGELVMLSDRPGATVVAVTADQGALVPTVSGDRAMLWFSRATSSASRLGFTHTALAANTPIKHRGFARNMPEDTTSATAVGDVVDVTTAATFEAMVVDWAGAATLKHYVNGALGDTTAFTTGTPSNSNTAASSNAYMGCNGSTAVASHFEGLIGYIGVWPRVLTEAELLSLQGDLTSFGVPAPPASLAAPTNLAASVISPTRIDLAWNAVPTAVRYSIERNSVVIATSTTASYSDTAASPSTTYTYRVRAET